MKKIATLISVLLFLVVTPATNATTSWTEGKNYFLIAKPQRWVETPGKVEVTEIFSYGCPACFQFVPTMQKLKRSLPRNVELDYLPASFHPEEDWVVFQRAYLTASILGVADKAHDAIYDAIWKTGELAVIDPATRRPKKLLPTIEDVANFYHRQTGIDAAQFVSPAMLFSVDSKMRRADAMIGGYQVDRTPTIVVNGKYMCHVESAGGPEQLIELVNWLVAKETHK
jgi:thiol:disulfide interchange protein DsbA